MSHEIFHPRLNNHGESVRVYCPSLPSAGALWSMPDRIASCVPDGGDLPQHLNGIRIKAAKPTDEMFRRLALRHDFDEPPFCDYMKRPAAGVIVIEPHPDRRVWVISPTNQYWEYINTFPKGRVAPEKRTAQGVAIQDLRETAIRETWEETGLVVKLGGLAVPEVERTSSTTRYYFGTRIAGDPRAMGWETQQVSLVPLRDLVAFVNKQTDKDIAKTILSLAHRM